MLLIFTAFRCCNHLFSGLGKRLEEGVGVVDVSVLAHRFQKLHGHRDIFLSLWHRVWMLADTSEGLNSFICQSFKLCQISLVSA